MRTDTPGHITAPIVIVACALAVFVVVVVGIALARRGRPPTETRITPPLRTGQQRAARASLQAGAAPVLINGYENPTYQYYDRAAAEKQLSHHVDEVSAED